MSRPSLVALQRILLVVAFALAASSVPSQANEAAEFAGFYEITNANAQTNGVQLTFSVRVFNRGSIDVAGGAVKLYDSAATDVVHGLFPDVTLAHESQIRLSGTFTIPQREYDFWQQPEAGGGPNLWIEFTDGSGNAVKQRIELNAAPVGEDN